MPRTMDDAEDESERKVVADVAQYGWHIVKVGAGEGEPQFAFTIGLPTTCGHPELVIVGLGHDTTMAILNDLGDEIRKGARFRCGDVSDLALDGYDVSFVDVAKSNHRDWLGYARWYHQGDGFDALQVVWPDRERHFPWDPDAPEAFTKYQRLLGAPRLWRAAARR